MKNSKLPGANKALDPNSVKFIIVHCSATPRGHDVGLCDIRQWHLKYGWRDVGYHYVVRLDGTIEKGRPLDCIGAHCKRFNHCSIGVCYVGGVKDDGRTPADTRTEQQKRALRQLLTELLSMFPNAEIRGHCDFAPKSCPSFNATAEYANLKGFSAPIEQPSIHSSKTYTLKPKYYEYHS